MSNHEDPFAILGVRREASLEEVKRAYRRLAMHWHPDRNPSPAAGRQFQRVHAAYELFLDPQRLAEWQQTTAPNGEAASGNAADDLTQGLLLTLEEAAQGCCKSIELVHSVRCLTCRASGRVQHNHSVACPRCSGCGRLARKGGGTTRCEGCAGRGYLRETRCTDCDGSGWCSETRTLAVRVPAGLLDGERLRLVGQAPLKPGADIATAGDLYLEISIAAHALFVLDGRDVHCEVPVSVFRMLCGGCIEVPTLAGTASLELPRDAKSPLEQRMPGLGFPAKRGRRAGDLVVHLQCVYPDSVSPRDIELLEGMEAQLLAELGRRSPQLAAWQAQMHARRHTGAA